MIRHALFLFAICGIVVGCGGGGYESADDLQAVSDSNPQKAADATAPAGSQASGKPEKKRSPAPPRDNEVAADEVSAPDPDPVTKPAAEPRAYKPRSNSVVGSVLGARDRNTALSNGRQLAMGMIQGDRLPAPAILSSDGKPLLSWRVKVLQSLDKNFYNAFNLQEAWDHPDNQKLIKQMPSIFKAGYAFEDEGFTVVKVVTGKETMFPTGAKRGLSLQRASDGASKTVMFVYANPNKNVPWTKPEDIEYDPEAPGVGVIGEDGTFIAAFCDGSIKRLSGLRGETINAILTCRGGEVVGNLD